MHAYLIDEDTSSVIGRFDSIRVAQLVKENAVFNAGIITERDESLEPYTTQKLTALYNSLRKKEERVNSFRSKDDAKRRLVRALRETDDGRRDKPKTDKVENFPALMQTDRLHQVRRTSRLGKILVRMMDGATLDELAETINYPKNLIWRDHGLKRKGYGRRFENGKFYLVLPDGVKQPNLID